MVPLKRYFLYIEAPSLTICPYDINPMKMQNRQNLKCHFACPRTSASVNLIHYRFVIRLSCLADSKSRYFQLNSEGLGLFIFVIDGLGLCDGQPGEEYMNWADPTWELIRQRV